MIKFFPDLDLTNNLVGVLIRFRKYPVAVVEDVRAMFIQVRVAPVDQSALRFLWWNDSNPTRPPKDHQMTVHCFGLTSSPSVAGFALRRTAEENRASVSEDVVEVGLPYFEMQKSSHWMKNFHETKFMAPSTFFFKKSGTVSCGYGLDCRGKGADQRPKTKIGVISKKKKKKRSSPVSSTFCVIFKPKCG